jgi:hypothetical protein
MAWQVVVRGRANNGSEPDERLLIEHREGGNARRGNAPLALSEQLSPARLLELNYRVIDLAPIDLFIFLGDVAPRS